MLMTERPFYVVHITFHSLATCQVSKNRWKYFLKVYFIIQFIKINRIPASSLTNKPSGGLAVACVVVRFSLLV